MGEASDLGHKPPLFEELEPRLLLSGNLFVNEFMAVNHDALFDSDGDSSDWLEIHNATTADIDLDGWFLTDKTSNLTKWRIPDVTIPAGGYLLIWASDKDRTDPASELHTNFGLSGGGEYLALVQPDGATVEHHYWPEFPPQVADVSYGLTEVTTTVTLLTDGASAAVLIPADGSLGTSWTAEAFDDSGWTHGPTGIGYDNEPIIIPGGMITLVDTGHDATALVPSGDIGTAWRERIFDDSGWMAGVTGVGYERDSGYESLIGLDVDSVMYGVNTTAYTRVAFDVLDPTELSSLILEMRYDDGFVASLNGQEVARVNAPDPLEWDSAATATSEADDWVSYDISGHLGDLVAGTNVLAFQGLNCEVANQDFLVLPRLLAEGPVRVYAYADLIQTDVEAEMFAAGSSAYVRVPFDVSGAADLDTLLLQMMYDDGYVASLNGVKVAERNAPPAPQWDSPATGAHDDDDAAVYETEDISADIGLLHDGTNVLAIHGLNVSASDSDFLLVPRLLASGPTGQPQDLERYFVVPTPAAPNGTGTADLGPIITDVTHSPDEPGDGDDLTVTANVRESFNPVTSVTLYYRVMFGSEASVSMFDDGAHGDGGAGDGVYGAVIAAGVSQPGQMVRYYVAAADSVSSSRWPVFPDPSDSAEYLGTVVADPSVTSNLPILTWFVEDTAAADTDTGTRAQMWYLGEFYDNIFVRIRGGTASGYPKKFYKFRFNREHWFRFHPDELRVKEFNLNSTWPDKAYVRQFLAYELLRDAGAEYSYSFPMRVQRNNDFFSVAIFIEQPDERYLERQDLGPEGALYKFNQSWPYENYMHMATEQYGVEKKTRLDEDRSDLQALIDGIHQPYLEEYMCDHVNLPSAISYVSAIALLGDTDCGKKNYYMYRDTEGTQEWRMLPWDKDLVFGRYCCPVLQDHIKSSSDVRPVTWNHFVARLVMSVPSFVEMYMRRLRTVMDQLLKPPGTPRDQRPLEMRMDELYTLMLPDVLLDRAKWGYWGGVDRPFDVALGLIENTYLAGVRQQFYSADSMPDAQPDYFPIEFGEIEYGPASGDQLEEYIELINPNDFAVDISGWKLASAVDFTFAPGTVIRSNSSVYVTRDLVSFRARETGPSRGQGLFVVGNYDGGLAADGETLRLFNERDEEILSTFVGQQAVYINEIMAHTDEPTGDWIELHNAIDSDVQLGGFFLSDDRDDLTKYQIPPGTVLHPGEYLVLTEAAHFGGTFALSRHGESIYLTIAGGHILDQHDFGSSDTGVSSGRYVTSDGAVNFPLLEYPTPGGPNADPIVGPAVINELMYHPVEGDDEFIELHNITPTAVKLYDVDHPSHTWRLEGGVDYDFSQGVEIPGNGFILAVGVDLSDPADEAAFRTKYDIPAEVEIYGPYSGKLSNGGESVRILRPGEPDPGSGFFSYIRVDRVKYNDVFPWPEQADGLGPSLERIHRDEYGNDPANWQAQHAGGSPGRANRINTMAPEVDAGPDQEIILPAHAVLDATVIDDDLPDPPGAVTVSWSKADGPGEVAFADADATDTTAEFSLPGTYVLRLTADDGDLQGYDGCTITVYPELLAGAAGDPLSGLDPLTVSFTGTASGGNPPLAGEFIESGGIVVMEAENFTGNDVRNDPDPVVFEVGSGGAYAGFVGAGYVFTPVSGGTAHGAWSDACDVSYNIEFSSGGNYAIWLRRYAPDGATNSCYVGANGSQVGVVFDNGGSYAQWTWVQHSEMLSVVPGHHVFNIRRRESGYLIDRIVLTKNGDTPSGPGPAENARASGHTYSWDFGDTAASDQQSPTHEYTGHGVYTVELTVSDGTHQASDTLEVVVGGAPGDANGDGTVDGADYTAWADHYGQGAAVPIPGDANQDKVVDGADYTAWADHYGQPGEPDEGDFTGNGFVDGADYTVWADHYQLAALAWTEGDFSGNGFVDGADYTAWADHYGESVGGASGGEGESPAAPVGVLSFDSATDAQASEAVALLSSQPPTSPLPCGAEKAGAAVGPHREHLGITVPAMDVPSMPLREPEGLLSTQAARRTRPPTPRGVGGNDWRLAPDVLNVLGSPDLSVLEAAV